MRYTTIIGLLLIAIGFVITMIGDIDFSYLVKNYEFLLGILFGGGFGILLGGVMGWLYKKRKIKVVEAVGTSKDTTDTVEKIESV